MKRNLITLIRGMCERIAFSPTLATAAFVSNSTHFNQAPRTALQVSEAGSTKSQGQKLAKWFLRVLTIAVAMPVGIAAAQTVKVSPTGYVTAGLGASVQFTATVTGLSSSDVNWYAGGTLGGNTTAGKISTTGVYTAPTTMPGQNPVQIRAVSKVNTSVSGTQYICLLGAGPTITSVTPNPISPGNLTVTIKGSGFQQYATVLDTTNGSPVQLSTTSVTNDTVIATGWQANGPSATFVVTNPGTSPSNAIVVPISSGEVNYALTVTNGSGTGTYQVGKVVTITANAAPAGQSFLNWTGAVVANANSPTTTLTMPAAATTVKANYTTSNGLYQLNVTNGSGGGSYAPGTVVTITANAPPAGSAFLNWTGSAVANANSATTTITMPSANASVTANYTAVNSQYQLTVNNGSGSGSYSAGTVVTITANAPPAGNVFVNWTGSAVANANNATTTITMPSAATSVTANYSVAQQIPFPVTTHPRLWITPSDLPRLQSWAVSSNPTYQTGMLPLLNQAVSIYQNQFFPGGVANPNYPDLGDTQGYQGQLTEEVGFILAFNSLIDPSAANRIKYAQYARNLLMYAMNQAALGPQSGAPFRDPLFALYNRANETGAQWGLIVDWIYNAKDAQNNPILTAADKATIRTVFMIWANQCLSAYTTGGDHPSPIGATNSFSLIGGGTGAYRMASNNYYLGHARLMTTMALSFDPSDDPVIDNTKSPATLGNSLRSYILNANGAWLYQEYAMMGDPQTVKADYNLPGNGSGFGLASGGLPPEGMLYGHSFGFILGQLLALQTSGFADPTITGPQAKLATAPVWDRFITGYLSSMTPLAATPASESWLGPVYLLASYGDLLRLWVTPDAMQPFALLAILEQQQGQNTWHQNAARWFTKNAIQGSLTYNVSQPWTWGTAQSVLAYLLMDPNAAPATDPRPTLPLNFVDAPAGRVLSRTNWNSNATTFSYRASWESDNHQDGDGGQFEFFRNGEWLTKEMSNYDNNGLGLTTYYHNTLALQNWCQNGTPNLNWFEAGEWANGSQWILGLSAGDPVTTTSNGPGYTYVNSDLTKLYNRPNIWTPSNGATDITQATRSIVWLNSDYVVVYDRATSIHSGLFKRFNLNFATPPSIAGKTATETMADGQLLFVQTLLPANSTSSSRLSANDLSPHSDLDPMFFTYTVQDPSNPSDTRFLHVLQGSDPNGAMVPATYVTSTTGTAFDGAIFGSAAVFFLNTANVNVVATTFTVPSSVHTFVVTGLAANTSYNVAVNGTTITLTPGGTGNLSDAAGLIKVSF